LDVWVGGESKNDYRSLGRVLKNVVVMCQNLRSSHHGSVAELENFIILLY
jgi:hypothetical protein